MWSTLNVMPVTEYLPADRPIYAASPAPLEWDEALKKDQISEEIFDAKTFVNIFSTIYSQIEKIMAEVRAGSNVRVAIVIENKVLPDAVETPKALSLTEPELKDAIA